MYSADVAATATINAAWIALAGALVAVLLTLIGAAIGAGFQARREHRKWIRDQRLRAYADHLAATDNFTRAALRGDESELPVIGAESIKAMSLVHLVGPDSVYALAEAFQTATRAAIGALGGDEAVLDALDDDRIAKRRAFIEAAREEARIEK